MFKHFKLQLVITFLALSVSLGTAANQSNSNPKDNLPKVKVKQPIRTAVTESPPPRHQDNQKQTSHVSGQDPFKAHNELWVQTKFLITKEASKRALNKSTDYAELENVNIATSPAVYKNNKNLVYLRLGPVYSNKQFLEVCGLITGRTDMCKLIKPKVE